MQCIQCISFEETPCLCKSLDALGCVVMEAAGFHEAGGRRKGGRASEGSLAMPASPSKVSLVIESLRPGDSVVKMASETRSRQRNQSKSVKRR